MTRGRWIALASAVAVVGGLAAGLIELKPELLGRRTGGPLACELCSRTGTGLPAEVGQPVSMGPLSLRNNGHQTVTLERVELLDVDPRLEVVGMLVVEPDGRNPLVGSGYGFPPREPGGTTRHVRAYSLEPARSNADYVQILIGLRLKSQGRAGARRIAVEYRADGVPYRAYFDHSMWLCTDRNDPERCIDPEWLD